MDKADILQHVGLDAKEAGVYLAILELGSATITPIARRSGVKRTSIYYFIDRLVELGLIEQVKLRGRMHYKALSPKRLVELEQSRLDAVTEALPEFLSAFNAVQGKPRISYYEGPAQMRNIVLEEPRCQAEVKYIWPGRDITEMIGGKRFMEGVDRARIKAGVWVRTIRFREKDIPFATSAHGPEYLRELRFAPSDSPITMGIGIYDTGKVSFFSSKKEGFGILIESAELVTAMTMLWQLLWDKSEPAGQGEG